MLAEITVCVYCVPVHIMSAIIMPISPRGGTVVQRFSELMHGIHFLTFLP